jgi:outer membrane immunogenic protein
MKLILAALALVATCGVAVSADLAESPSPARFGWDGAYVGLSGGYGWLQDTDYQFTPPLDDQGEDWIFGAHAGYLVGMGNFVIGAEAEATKLDIAYEGFDFITVEEAYAIKARAGFAIDRFLVSGNVGAAYLTTNFLGLKDWGWTAGAGVDYALTDLVTVGAQYSRYQFEEFDGTQIDGHVDAVTARVGLKF